MATKQEVNGNGKEGLFGSALQNLRSAWREIVRVSRKSDTPDISNPENLRAQIEACLEKKGGDVSARHRAAELARAYLAFPPAKRLAFLRVLSSEYGADADLIAGAVAGLDAATSAEEVETARYRLRQALEPARLNLLREFNTLQSGPRFLVQLRKDLIDFKKEHPELGPLERDLRELLRSWFDIGFLEMQSITWNSPASLLEKLGRYEAVHRVRSWLDLKNRLDIDRRCFAFFHPCMREEPLIFIEVALVKGLAVQIQELLDEKAEVLESDEADTAIFYSISNAQKGLVGISFGNFLIKQVVAKLRQELPNLKRFATLSPLPGFARWLARELEVENVSLRPGELKKFKALGLEESPLQLLAQVAQSGKWARDASVCEALKPVLLRLCADYLLNAKRKGGAKAADPVAHFHLTNGARVEQINWMGDTSGKGMQESAGLMVNYLYRLDRIDRFHEDYQSRGKINASKSVKGLLD
ncbi:malonyl-CoA decarboxylase [Pelagicoccus sp. SDUM812003]|uniref:malonyl-CoA decarboxylase n=1 Tax=Pelagicoccus sp. SDUM812003 TaxID=3041267 RepID=UPI00280EC222|nr:malonyl-CoA decarboxylase [Pelagicoccus sp. SDUM812003]MDQ8203572.1 malonyl-CoA decarboxylase [Pelagicoccus sp. SDUM812003]